jgi:hypothetical protein
MPWCCSSFVGSAKMIRHTSSDNSKWEFLELQLVSILFTKRYERKDVSEFKF